jgi:hypothetical protein
VHVHGERTLWALRSGHCRLMFGTVEKLGGETKITAPKLKHFALRGIF